MSPLRGQSFKTSFCILLFFHNFYNFMEKVSKLCKMSDYGGKKIAYAIKSN